VIDQDPPEVYSESELKVYGRKIAQQVSQVDGMNSRVDFREINKLSLAEKKEQALRQLGVSARAANALETHKGILFVGQLLQVSCFEIMAIPNCGKKTIIDLINCLECLNLLELWDWDPEEFPLD
jgi:DNA-directed RNA polymerase alpha subunit